MTDIQTRRLLRRSALRKLFLVTTAVAIIDISAMCFGGQIATRGTDGNDVLRGNGRAITLAGGKGDDRYFLYGNETVVEHPGEGTDTIIGTSRQIPPNVENMELDRAGWVVGNGEGNTISNLSTGQPWQVMPLGGASRIIIDRKNGPCTIVLTDLRTKIVGFRKGTDQIRDYVGNRTTVSRLDRAMMGRRVFYDEFKVLDAGEEISRRYRTVYQSGNPQEARSLPGNKEKQVYVDTALSPGPDGLTITSDRIGRADKAQYPWASYTSGMINTRFSFAQKTGFFGAAFSAPEDVGFWPAFWLLPQNYYGRWPRGGEIDAVERGGTPHVGWAGLINGEPRAQGQSPDTEVVLSPYPFTDYIVELTDNEVVWYYDGFEVKRRPRALGMDSPMYMVLNLAVGGDWFGEPASNAHFPAQMKIRYLAAWTLKGD